MVRMEIAGRANLILAFDDTAFACCDEFTTFPQNKNIVLVHHGANIASDVVESGFDTFCVERSAGGTIVFENIGNSQLFLLSILSACLSSKKML